MGPQHIKPLQNRRRTAAPGFAPILPSSGSLPPAHSPSPASPSAPLTTTACAAPGHRPRHARRSFLRFAAASISTGLLPQAWRADRDARCEDVTILPSAAAAASTEWAQDDLCGSCQGRGRQTCSFCEGSGAIRIDDSIVEQELECPNCQGKGFVVCPACIGLGLADVSGILRKGTSFSFLNTLQCCALSHMFPHTGRRQRFAGRFARRQRCEMRTRQGLSIHTSAADINNLIVRRLPTTFKRLP